MKRIREQKNNSDHAKLTIWHNLIPGFGNNDFENKNNSISQAMSIMRFFDKNLFYPLIGQIFSEMGFKINVTRDGDTNNRADAIILDDKYSIPIEIKSPTEVEYVNIKSIRQALENKIILLSRKFYPTSTDTASLAIALFYPEDRSGVQELVDDFYKVYNLKVGYIDMFDLLSLHWDCVFEGTIVNIHTFQSIKGKYNS